MVYTIREKGAREEVEAKILTCVLLSNRLFVIVQQGEISTRIRIYLILCEYAFLFSVSM